MGKVQQMTKDSRGLRSPAIEATTFWLVIPAAVLLAIGYQAWVQGGPYLFAGDFLFVILFIVFAYGSWKMTKWGLIGGITLSLIFAVLRVAFGVSSIGDNLESAIQGNAITEIPALMVLFYGYRGYKELGVAKKQ